MRLGREKAAIAVSAPLMIAGLAAAALASGWPMRLGGAGMVIGASVAIGLTGRRVRTLGWTLALAGALAVLVACL